MSTLCRESSHSWTTELLLESYSDPSITEKIKETETFIIKKLFSCNKRLNVSIDQRMQKMLSCIRGQILSKTKNGKKTDVHKH